jgi:hypothetical protein
LPGVGESRHDPGVKSRDAIADALDELASIIAERVWLRFQQGTPNMIDQSKSPLGRRRHCYAVRRRISEHQPGAAVVGRRHLLTQEALTEELSRLGFGDRRPTTGRASPTPSKGESVADKLRRELGLLKDARRRGASEDEITFAVTGRRPRKRPRQPPKSSKS